LASTDTVSSNNGELDVSFFSPGGTPGVLDEPVVQSGSGVSSIADSKHGVVKFGSAAGVIKDTGFVELEFWFVCLN